ncbi:MAG: DsbA family oxidoreductase [Chloroflexi bacterium]|nr:DsbA family oxidoreductase [Chloroflexota bacterium]
MHIEVYQDTACPWCRIGRRHLQLALERWDGEPVTVQYRPFFLNESIPPQGYDFLPYMTAKGGGRITPAMFFDAPRRMGAAVGLTFNFDRITRAPNTLLSHRLVALAPQAHKEAVIDAVYAAYFEFGQDIGSVEVLAQIAAQAGLDADAMHRRLLTDEAREQVIAEAHDAHDLGITGVPFFILNRRYALSGAQPPDVMLRAMQQAAAVART